MEHDKRLEIEYFDVKKKEIIECDEMYTDDDGFLYIRNKEGHNIRHPSTPYEVVRMINTKTIRDIKITHRDDEAL